MFMVEFNGKSQQVASLVGKLEGFAYNMDHSRVFRAWIPRSELASKVRA